MTTSKISELFSRFFVRWTKFASVGMEQAPVELNTTVCAQLPGFVTEQREICESKPLVVPSIRKGVLLAMEECKKQLSEERWDCSTMTEATALKGLLAIRKFRLVRVHFYLHLYGHMAI